MKTNTLTINNQDYALVVKYSGKYNAHEQANIELLEELHKVKHFKSKREMDVWIAGQIKCAQKPFFDRVARVGYQEAVAMGPSPKRTANHPWRLNKATF